MADKPPKLKDYPYDKWVLLVTIWSEQFITDPKNRANRVIILALEGDDQDAALEIGQTELKSDEGLARMQTDDPAACQALCGKVSDQRKAVCSARRALEILNRKFKDFI